jgi:parvulin-like peptidyl-prolyl cis-trans isomerase-like protein
LEEDIAMLRRTTLTLALAAALAACGQRASTGNSPLVAKGDGIALAADEVKARIDEQPPMIRPAFAQMDAKRMMVDNLLKVDVLANAAEKAGVQNDPDVRYKIKTILAGKYQQMYLSDPERVRNAIPDAEVAKYYEEHADEFHQPLRVHAAHILVAADASGPARAKKLAVAKGLLKRVLAEQKGNRSAFALVARESSDDAETKATGGDLMYKSREALEKAMGKELAELAFSMGDDETSSKIVETAKGFHLVHVYGRAAAMDDTLEEARPEITRTLLTQWKSKAFEDLVKQLREDLHVTVDDAALASVMPSGVPAAAPPAAAPVTPAASTAPAPSAR